MSKAEPSVYRAVIFDILKPARELGMTTIKVVDPARALRDLETVLGFPLGGAEF